MQPAMDMMESLNTALYSCGKKFFSLLCPIVFSPFDRPLTHKSFFNIVYFSLIPLSAAGLSGPMKTAKLEFKGVFSQKMICFCCLSLYHQNIFIYTSLFLHIFALFHGILFFFLLVLE